MRRQPLYCKTDALLGFTLQLVGMKLASNSRSGRSIFPQRHSPVWQSKLVEWYKAIADSQQIELVLVSSDKSATEFQVRGQHSPALACRALH